MGSIRGKKERLERALLDVNVKLDGLTAAFNDDEMYSILADLKDNDFSNLNLDGDDLEPGEYGGILMEFIVQNTAVKIAYLFLMKQKLELQIGETT